MDEKRKEIIIKEIETWKESGLIPKQYCDFLLTLYTGGNEERANMKKDVSLFGKLQLVFPAVLLIIFLCIYFTNLSSIMQITIGMVIFIVMLISAINIKRHHVFLSYFYYFVSALLLYLLTVEIIIKVFAVNDTYLAVLTLIHCSVWLFVGVKWRIHFFTIASLLGFIGLMIQVV